MLSVFMLIVSVEVITRGLLNESILSSRLNERRMERRIEYYFDHMVNGRDFVNRVGNYVRYPYYRDFGIGSITPFNRNWVLNSDPDWIRMYIFAPGTTREEIREITGSRGALLPKVVQEGYTQILFFAPGRRIVCNIHSNNKNFEFDFGEFEDGHIRLTFIDAIPITLTQSEETGRIVVRLVTDID